MKVLKRLTTVQAIEKRGLEPSGSLHGEAVQAWNLLYLQTGMCLSHARRMESVQKPQATKYFASACATYQYPITFMINCFVFP